VAIACWLRVGRRRFSQPSESWTDGPSFSAATMSAFGRLAATSTSKLRPISKSLGFFSTSSAERGSIPATVEPEHNRIPPTAGASGIGAGR
jgi:hypothetical protein